MDARQLRYFVQIVESGSLSKAARQLFVVQPALSQQVARLEEEVGRPLLVRSARGVVPTPSGEALYHHAKFVLRQLDEAVLVARREYTDVRGRVTLGLAPSTSNVLGLPLLRHLKAGYPGITLNVVVALPTHLEERARQSQLDVAVLFSRTAASDMVFEPLLDEDVFAIVPAGTALLPPSKMSLTLAELAALPLVMSSPQHNIRRQLTLELERAGLEANIVAEIDSPELVMRYVAEGAGATVQPMAATLGADGPPAWRCLPITDAPMTRPNYLYAQPIQRLTASASVVRAELRHVARRLVDEGVWSGVRWLPDDDGRDRA
jgi:LysR family tcuABC transcriptional regulator